MENGLNPAEKKLEKRIAVHSWIASATAIFAAIIVIFIVYGKVLTGIEINEKEHKAFNQENQEQTKAIKQLTVNQNVMYYNLLQLAKKFNYELTKEEEIFLNDYRSK